ncbi:Transposon expressed, partial [Globisporangium splendens]
MSPTTAPAASAFASHPPSFEAADDVDWKLQRKLKHQRDVVKRSVTPKPKFKQHSHHHQSHHQAIPLQELRREWLASKEDGGGGRARSIPGRRRDKASALSKSVPQTTAVSSWPPASRDGDFDENLDPNAWDVTTVNATPLSRSAPKESSSSVLSRSQGSSKREARSPMTLFDIASFYNESGNLLSHDNFEALGSSPDVLKRKSKRRVGRRKNEKTTKRDDVSHAALNKEEIVLELMGYLFPHLDVGKELNLLFLTNGKHQQQQHGGDVFHFEEDEESVGRKQRQPKPKNADLELDVLKFQKVLTKLVFEESTVDLPVEILQQQQLAASELAEVLFTEQWIAKTVLEIVKLDVLAQFDRFAVLLAVFRTMHHRRSAILEIISSACLAIYHHQGIDSLSGQFAAVEYVSMKGVIALLAGVLSAMERDFMDSVEMDEETVHAMCEQISHSVKLLLRSSPGKARRQDENNQLEKYNEDSDSVEATTYGALGEVLYSLATFSPVHGEDFLRWMLQRWPTRNVSLQLFFVRFTGGLLAQFMLCGLCFPADVVWKAFSRIEMCIKSPHFLLSKEACSLCGNLPLMDMYLSRDQALREKLASALHENARSHWNERIRELSDEHFDVLLDFA